MREWLRKLRVDAQMSQEEMGRKLGCTRQQVAFLERGERQADLSLSTMVKISEIFNITLEDIKKFETAITR